MKNMKKKLSIILVVFIGNICYSQEADTTAILNISLEQGKIMTESFQTGEYDKFIDFVHPKIIEMTGGRDSMKIMFEGIGPEVEFISNELTMPNKLIIKDTLYQCAFDQRQVIRIKEQKFYTLGSLIGISYDSGSNWFFISVASNTLTNLQQKFPELSNDLEIKKQTYPVLID